MKKNIYVVIAMLVSLFGCSVDRKDYSYESCFVASDCIERYGKKSDKTGCAEYIRECAKDLDEARTRSRMEYCLRWYGSLDMDTQENCRLKLIPKK